MALSLLHQLLYSQRVLRDSGQLVILALFFLHQPYDTFPTLLHSCLFLLYLPSLLLFHLSSSIFADTRFSNILTLEQHLGRRWHLLFLADSIVGRSSCCLGSIRCDVNNGFCVHHLLKFLLRSRATSTTAVFRLLHHIIDGLLANFEHWEPAISLVGMLC